MKKKQFRLRKSVIIFGGSFSPFHDGHAKICKLLACKKLQNKVIIVPSFAKHYVNYNQLESADVRLQMIQIVCADFKISHIEVSHFEINQGNVVPSFQTIDHFQKKYPKKQIYFVIGDDNLQHSIELWERFEQFGEKYKFIIANRNPNFTIQQLNPTVQKFYNSAVLLHNPIFLYSSTEFHNGNNLGKYNRKLVNFSNKQSLFWEKRLVAKINKERQKHSQNVAKLAVYYGGKYGVNKRQLFFAGIYHDLYKNIALISKEQKAMYLSEWERKFDAKTWHGFICARILKKEWKVKNINILMAIRHHTVPSLSANIFQKIIYCADKLSYERCEKSYLQKMRVLAKENIDAAFKQILFYELCALLETKNEKNSYFIKIAHKYFSKVDTKTIIELINR